MNILLVEPDFPLPKKSKNHSSFLPIGLLKIASYHRLKGDNVLLVRGNVRREDIEMNPEVIKITSLFTYWSHYVKQCVEHYRQLLPDSKIELGGIFASLMPQAAKEITGADEVKVGLYEAGRAEDVEIDYSLLPEDVGFQIVHASRGCFRRCSFCGCWKIEPDVSYKKSILKEIRKNRLVFYDNNLLANRYIEDVLDELSQFKLNGKVVHSECQSGIDGRILVGRPSVAIKLKKARFLNPRLAWDSPLSDYKSIKEQIDVLIRAGYKANHKAADIFIFMLFNHDQSYEELEAKLECCRRWGVLVIDCRYRPLDLLEDKYNPRAKRQEHGEYYLHKGWTDYEVRDFRRKVRRQNIAIRLGLPGNRYIEGVERGYIRI